MSDAGCGDPRCRVDYCRGSREEKQETVTPESASLRDRIAKAIFIDWCDYNGAECDWEQFDHVERSVRARYLALADAVIAELGRTHAVVELPGPPNYGDNGWAGEYGGWKCWPLPMEGDVVVDNRAITAAEARALAGAILAAADVAEAEK